MWWSCSMYIIKRLPTDLTYHKKETASFGAVFLLGNNFREKKYIRIKGILKVPRKGAKKLKRTNNMLLRRKARCAFELS
jgi:hypothetical protein